MLDLIYPGDKFNIFKFAKMSNKVIEHLQRIKKMAVIVGGSGLYIKSITNGIISLPSDKNIRDKLSKEDPKFLYNKLLKVDLEYALKISSNNIRRVIRALEIYEITKKKFSYFHSITEKKFDFFKFGLIRNRDSLYKDINNRVDMMFREGLLEEAKRIYEDYRDKISNIKVIGYNEIFDVFKNNLTLEEAKLLK